MWSSWPWVTTTPAMRAPKVSRARKVGVNDVDAEAAVVERDAAVDEQDVAALLDGHAVHADLAEAAERQERRRAGAARAGCGEAGDDGTRHGLSTAWRPGLQGRRVPLSSR